VSYILCFGDFFCFSILFAFLRMYFILFLVLPHFLFSTFLAITSPTYTNGGMNSNFFCLYTFYKGYINKNSIYSAHYPHSRISVIKLDFGVLIKLYYFMINLNKWNKICQKASNFHLIPQIVQFTRLLCFTRLVLKFLDCCLMGICGLIFSCRRLCGACPEGHFFAH